MKLRKIIVEENTYLYKCTNGFFDNNSEIAVFLMTIYLENYKQNPLKIEFISYEDLYVGNPLKSGISLIRKSVGIKEVVNLNRPKYIRECILYALKIGWNGINKFEIINGLKILESLDYDISILHVQEKNIIAYGKEYSK